MVRVIAGLARGRKLVGPSWPGTRPISDRAKEALFAILGERVRGARVLDLFAGTGAVGIEALSRGAAHAVLVELYSAAIGDIRRNLDRTGLAGAATVVRADAFAYLRQRPEPFDLLFAGPPQWHDHWAAVLAALDRRLGWLAQDGVAVVQLDPREHRDLPLAHLAERDRRRYGDVQLGFYSRTDSSSSRSSTVATDRVL
jgi:16S rRNA (guanine(966)-N(2))-methyltransferase RsmD